MSLLVAWPHEMLPLGLCISLNSRNWRSVQHIICSPVDVVRVPLVEDVVFVSLRVVHRRTRIVKPTGRGIDVAVWSPTSEQGTVAHRPDLIGVDRRTLAALVLIVVLSQRSRQSRQKGGTESESLHHREP
jgi:hypothetical protein